MGDPGDELGTGDEEEVGKCRAKDTTEPHAEHGGAKLGITGIRVRPVRRGGIGDVREVGIDEGEEQDRPGEIDHGRELTGGHAQFGGENAGVEGAEHPGGEECGATDIEKKDAPRKTHPAFER